MHPPLALSFLAGEGPARRVMIVSPHPDDEVIGFGSRLPLLPHSIVVQVTDGAPPDDADARAAGCTSREEYARLRREETRLALARAGIERVIELKFPDQKTSFQLLELAERLASLCEQFQPEILVTVPYEGGHPDHDSTALACALARRFLARGRAPSLVEMLSYHASGGDCEMQGFLQENGETFVLPLTSEEKNFKRGLFECFRSQERVLRWFPIAVEKFRSAPDYDFSEPPHAGPLYYEKFSWGMEGAQWRSLAREALAHALFRKRPSLNLITA